MDCENRQVIWGDVDLVSTSVEASDAMHTKNGKRMVQQVKSQDVKMSRFQQSKIPEQNRTVFFFESWFIGS